MSDPNTPAFTPGIQYFDSLEALSKASGLDGSTLQALQPFVTLISRGVWFTWGIPAQDQREIYSGIIGDTPSVREFKVYARGVLNSNSLDIPLTPPVGLEIVDLFDITGSVTGKATLDTRPNPKYSYPFGYHNPSTPSVFVNASLTWDSFDKPHFLIETSGFVGTPTFIIKMTYTPDTYVAASTTGSNTGTSTTPVVTPKIRR